MLGPLIDPPDAASAHGGTWCEVEPPRTYELAKPRVFGRRPFDYEARFATVSGHAPEAGVVELPGGRLVGIDGTPVTPTGEVVLMATAYANVPDERFEGSAVARGEVRRLLGSLLSLCSEWASHNYAHFLLDGIARLDLVERASLAATDFDHVLVAPLPAAEQWIDRLGLPREKIVWAQPGIDLVADSVVFTTYPRAGRICPPWIVDFLRRRLGPEHGAAQHGRIFAARRDCTRLLSNANDIEAIAVARGCEIVVPAAGVDLRPEFASASLVVGPDGAGLTNIVFSPPGARLLDLVPSDQIGPFLYSLSCAAQVEYSCLIGTSEGTRPLADFGPSPFDFSIDPDEFRVALDDVLRH